MTIVNSHTSAHHGRLVTESGDALDVELEVIGGRTLRLSAGGDELGTWPVDECHIVSDPQADAAYRMTVDGDDVVFTPASPTQFGDFVSTLFTDDGERDEEDHGEHPNGEQQHAEQRSSRHDDGTADEPEGPAEAAADPTDPTVFLFGAPRRTPPPAPEDEVADDAPVVDVIVEPPVDDGAIGMVDPVDADASSVGDDADVVDGPAENVVIVDDDAEAEDVVGDALDEGDIEGDVALTEPEATATDVDEPEAVEVDVEIDMPAAHPTDREIDPEVTADVDSDDGVILAVDVPENPATAPQPDDEVDDELGLPLVEVTEVAGPDVDPPAELDVPEAAAVDQGAARFGGSSLDRLSRAIDSMRVSRAASRSSDPSAGFEEAEDDEDYVLEDNHVAEDVLASQRSLRDHSRIRLLYGNRLRLLAGAGALVGVIAVLAILAPGALDFIRTYEGGPELPPTIPVPTTVVVPPTDVTTTVPTTSPSVPTGSGSIFDRPASDFVAAWDDAGVPISPVLEFGAVPLPGIFRHEFSAYQRIEGTVGPDGSMDQFSLVVDPNGPTEYDRLGIQALGVAIAAVDPDRSPEGRASLLAGLGLNVRRPDLGGIDGKVESDGVVYTLVFDPDTTLLTLTVTPEA